MFLRSLIFLLRLNIVPPNTPLRMKYFAYTSCLIKKKNRMTSYEYIILRVILQAYIKLLLKNSPHAEISGLLKKLKLSPMNQSNHSNKNQMGGGGDRISSLKTCSTVFCSTIIIFYWVYGNIPYELIYFLRKVVITNCNYIDSDVFKN